MKNPPPFVGSEFSPDDFSAICAILGQTGGVDLSGYKEGCVKRRIAARMRELGHHTPPPYIERLRHDPAECDTLLAALSLHVSRFFRDASTFAALRRRLPELAAATGARRGDPALRCWSAGCAGGEEAYSLAMLACATLPPEQPVTIRASDVSAEVLERARTGCFEVGRLGELPEEERRRWFVPGTTPATLVPELRSRVDFFRHDLLTGFPYPAADLILCRYVTIYFSAEEQERVVRGFAAALPPGGLLVLGRTEVLRDPAGLFEPVDAAEKIYRKAIRPI